MKTRRWMMLLTLASATLFVNGCHTSFWQGLWNTGWPTSNRWVNLGLDVVNEVVLK